MKLWRVEMMLYQELSPSTRREWIEMAPVPAVRLFDESPSTRREWIEIPLFSAGFFVIYCVSLHTEGVD